MPFAETLQQLRGAAGVTQAALAQASGLSLGVIRDYEQGNREPTLRSAMKLARALGVSVEALAVDEDATPSNTPAPRQRKPAAEQPKRKKRNNS